MPDQLVTADEMAAHDSISDSRTADCDVSLVQDFVILDEANLPLVCLAQFIVVERNGKNNRPCTVAF